MANVSQEVLDRQPAAILGRAIQKAIDNGWKSIDLPDFVSFKVKRPVHIDEYPWYLVRLFDNEGQEVEVNCEHVIFNHDFAKALWGEEPALAMTKPELLGYYDGKEWQHHLQLMVIADDPIKYLAKHIDN